MKKLFLTICFIAAAFNARADVIEVNNAAELQQRRQDTPPIAITDDRIPDGSDQNAVAAFIKERLQSKKVIIDSFDENDPNHLSSMNVQHSADYINSMEQDNRSTFEQIYDQALARISAQEQAANSDVIQDRQQLAAENLRQKQEWQQPLPNFPVVNVFLPPKGTKILAPAQEHIPFMFSDIEILSTGQISIEETIVVLANGKRLKYGLTRSLPQYTVSRDGKRHPLSINLSSVTINDQEIPYRLKTQGNRTFIIPATTYQLAPGVYTYKFKYVVNRHIWEYDDFNEFYWDVTGSNWNLVVARSGAMVTLPGQSKPLGQVAFTGRRGSLKNEAAIITADNNALGFISKTPLFIGEGLHLLISMPKADFIPVDSSQQFSWFLDDYGDIIISLIGLLAILGGYYISWRQLQQDQNRQRHSLKRNAPMLRYLAFNVFDKISFVSFLLELFKKQIIDISEQGEQISIIKKTDNTSSLTKVEKNVCQALFGKDSQIPVDNSSGLRIERAYLKLKQATLHQFRMFTIKANLGYILFSSGMVILSEVFIALLGYNFSHNLSFMIGISACFACCLGVIHHPIHNRYLRWALHGLCGIIILFGIMALNLYIKLIAAVFIFGMIYSIFAYSKIFARRNGLLKNNIKDAAEYYDYLRHNAEHISLGRDFLNQQSNIFAVEAQKHYPRTPQIADFYRLDIAQRLADKL